MDGKSLPSLFSLKKERREIRQIKDRKGKREEGKKEGRNRGLE